MSPQLTFIVVEDRQNKTLALCRESAARAQEVLQVLASTEGGADYERLCSRYIHLSSNTAAFEKICLRRYFLLAEFLKATPACRDFVLIDSDVLLFRGIGAHIRRLVGHADFSGSFIHPFEGWDPCQISPHVSYWSADGLAQFVAFVLELYDSASGHAQLRGIAEQFARRGVRGGISDMTLLHLWAHASGNTQPINRIFGGRVIDHNLNISHNLMAHEFSMRGGAKRIRHADGQPCFVTPAGRTVQALAMHFQGSAKLAMGPGLQGQAQRVAWLTAGLRVARRAKNLVFGIRALATRALGAARLRNVRAAE